MVFAASKFYKTFGVCGLQTQVPILPFNKGFFIIRTEAWINHIGVISLVMDKFISSTNVCALLGLVICIVSN